MMNSDEILNIFTILHAHHAEVFLVGGCIRDMLMQREVHDYDVTTSALPQDVTQYFQDAGYQVIPTGIQHGTVTVMMHGEPYEITTYRTEAGYQNYRSPSSVQFSSHILEDLQRRDFTINAIAYSIDGKLIDPYQGKDDIHNKMIRCVGLPNERFQEDALRILRALRFCATLDFSIEEHTWKAIQTNASLLRFISKERIREEFNKILLANKPNTLHFLREANVLCQILPGYDRIYDFPQHTPWHCYDLFQHTDVALNHTDQDPLICKLAIVLHDVGKVDCETFDEDGIAHYKKHALVSERFAYETLKLLTYDHQTIQHVCTLIHYHDYYITLKRSVIRRYLSKFNHNIPLALFALDVQLADDKAKNLALSSAKIDIIYEAKKLIMQMEKEQDLMCRKDLHITGHDIKALGYQGKQIGDILRLLYDEVLIDPSKNTKKKLLEKAIILREKIS